MSKQTWCQTFGKNMVKRKNILRISLVLLSNHEILQSNINTRFFIGLIQIHHITLRFTSKIWVRRQNAATCGTTKKLRTAWSTQRGMKSRKEAVTRGNREAWKVACDHALSQWSTLWFVFGSRALFFSLSSQRSQKKITPDLRLPGRKKALPSSYSVIMDADEILEEIGSFGFFQKRNAVFLGLIIFVLTFQTVSMVFIGGEPTWRCTANSSVCTQNATISPDDDYYKARCNMSSEDWEFTTEFTSIVTEVRMFDLWNYRVKN